MPTFSSVKNFEMILLLNCNYTNEYMSLILNDNYANSHQLKELCHGI